MSSEEIILRVNGISKCFEMYEKPIHRLWQTLCAGRKKFYKEFWALEDISFEVKRGECIGIIGRNGAGKSTLLQIITGTLQPTSGSVEVKGRIAALLELGSGFNPDFTGRENVYMNASILGFSQREIDERYQDIIDFADIGEFINQPVKTYSSGMIVRLAFAVQVILDPKLLIIDEALSVGDMFFQQKCFARIKELVNKGTTILFVSHDISLVKTLCSKVLYLNNGRQVEFGNARRLCEMYQNDMTVLAKAHTQTAGNGTTVRETPVSKELKFFRRDEELSKRVTERSGNRELEVVSMDFYSLAGDRISDCYVDDEIRVVISFEAHQEVESGAQIGFLCRDSRGNDVFTTNLERFAYFLPQLHTGQRGTAEWTFIMPVFGTFFFSTAIKPNTLKPIFYDRLFNVSMLRTLKRDLTDLTGALLVVKPHGLQFSIAEIHEPNTKSYALNSGERQTGTQLEQIRKDHVFRYQLVANSLSLMGKKPDRLLDVFCGNGYGSYMLAQAFPEASVIGWDGSEEAVACAKTHYQTLRGTFEMRRYPFQFEDGIAFDVIVSLESLEHIENDRAFLQDLLRVLKPDGYLFVSVPNQHLMPLEIIANPFHYRHYTNGAVEELFDSLGLIVVKRFGQYVYKQNANLEIAGLCPENEMDVTENEEGQFHIFILKKGGLK